ncbi:hypothetical protein KY289_024082 [Solanum tuberosum]|nr:hypothetical protein KY289_024082 [Solanum tuberosum]
MRLNLPIFPLVLQVIATQDKGAEEPDKDQQKKATESCKGQQERNTELQGIPDQNKIALKNNDKQQQRNGQLDQGKQTQGKTMQTGHIHNETNGQTSRKGELLKLVDNQTHKGKDSQKDQRRA